MRIADDIDIITRQNIENRAIRGRKQPAVIVAAPGPAADVEQFHAFFGIYGVHELLQQRVPFI
jgi:hypothetical protein